MVSVKVFDIIAAFLLCQLFSESVTQLCESEQSVFNKMLKGHTFKTIRVSNPIQCAQTCRKDLICQSINYDTSRGICELNNRTKEARPEHFVFNPDRFYFGGIKDRGKFNLNIRLNFCSH